MRVIVTGAYGLIGSACLTRLHAAGHEVIGAGRSIGAARRRFGFAQWIEADFTRLRDGAAWQPLLKNIDAVVNCVGVLQDSARDDVERVQLEGAVALFEGCARAGVGRVVYVSAIGAEVGGPTAFSRTKASAEAHLKTLDLDWAILRPALVLSPAVYGGSAILRGIAGFPGCVPVIGANARTQVIGVDDLTETVARLLAPRAPAKVVWDVAHPQVYALAAVVIAIRNWLGFPSRPMVPLPDAAGRAVAVLADAVGWLGWRSPARTTSFAHLTAGVVGEPVAWMEATGIRPRNLDEILATRPSTVQDRWFARLYFLKPLALVVLAMAMITGGAAEFASGWTLAEVWPLTPFDDLAARMLPKLGYGAFAVLLGFGIAFRPTARLALLALFIVGALLTAYQATAVWRTGAAEDTGLTRDVLLVLTSLFTLAILDER